MDALPNINPALGRTLNENQWREGEEAFKRTGQDVLVWDFQDGWQFWVVSHNGHMARKTVHNHEAWIEYCAFRQS